MSLCEGMWVFGREEGLYMCVGLGRGGGDKSLWRLSRDQDLVSNSQAQYRDAQASDSGPNKAV